MHKDDILLKIYINFLRYTLKYTESSPLAQQEVDRALKHYATQADLLAMQLRLIVGISTVMSAIAGLALAADKIWG